uniref:Uncharacterized protein n=1 Tax=Rheinheimera sp. BAL341 TaxID=1708203 RepID=A0A486XNB3_9GAMM
MCRLKQEICLAMPTGLAISLAFSRTTTERQAAAVFRYQTNENDSFFGLVT